MNVKALLLGGNRQAWSWNERLHEEGVTNGIEAWVHALRGDYRQGKTFRAEDLERYDLVILNLGISQLERYQSVLSNRATNRTKVVALHEGGLAELHQPWRPWSQVADLCDLVIAINGHGVSFMQALTSTPVVFIGIPYPVDGIRGYSVAIEERRHEVLLCAPPLVRPLDYLAARPLGLPMYAYESTIRRNVRDVWAHRTLNKEFYLNRARGLYADPNLEVLPQTGLVGFLEKAARTKLWMNLDTRYTWGRYVLDAAALGVPVITTRETWHGDILFPELVVSSPYDIDGATQLARRLLNDPEFYREVVEYAARGLDPYRPEVATERLMAELSENRRTPRQFL